ncbi:Apoptosis-stimulating of p53 protein 1 [Amphibalanus amphitrite]|uniref:Apoptosis-stimulating of p53 protein 1 n=1 Tax=Amphibalanus amphitrite TaxID=1232801 RepID=A0A6A4WTL1_AMPAM|nr:Apoptosis-stimulating of p53 protein 1 [Amphibalanus amphitrite]
MIPAIVRVVLDEGEVKCVPLTPETTARDVIECCRDPDEPFCTLTQTTRDGERVLALHERPLLLIQGQQEVGERVTFVLRYDMTQDVRGVAQY